MRRWAVPHAPTVYGSGGSPIATISGKKTVLEGSAGPYQTVPATAHTWYAALIGMSSALPTLAPYPSSCC